MVPLAKLFVLLVRRAPVSGNKSVSPAIGAWLFCQFPAVVQLPLVSEAPVQLRMVAPATSAGDDNARLRARRSSRIPPWPVFADSP